MTPVAQKPLTISVITVCFNSAQTLETALQSVVGQTWPHIEHIVIDGGSKDGTPEILERFRPHLAQIVSERDKGIYDAMNKGLARASGDVICFLNADDQYASPEVLSDVVQLMGQSSLDAVMGDVSFFHAENPNKIVRRYRSDRFHPDHLAYGWMPAHPALFLRRSVTERVGKFKDDYKIAGDFEFIVRAFTGTNLSYRHVPEVMVKMQTGGVSTAGLRAKIQLNKEVLRACRENGIRTNMLKILSKYPAKLLELVMK
ncbi:glycosyltransferase [Herbaspirillum lusitanum]|uniref:glycosyltransferase family 2 protein n=1 Tax=Herbaspirillum lusitanum TaxID=213312 RepID=UPI002237BEEA|nr:glycosyltransferase family 2 protein [Herbaspirillum lusitanum]MCW5296892.1 glycosyltransferase [Herbaspirillum lusitanum]